MLLIQQPSMQWVDPVKNSAIFQGKMYFGLPRTDPKLLANRVQVYYFDTLGNPQPLPQPVNLSDSGVPTYLGNPVEIYANETCSIRVDDRNGLEKYLVDEYPLRSSEVVGVDSIKSLPSADFATGQYSVTGFYAGSTIGGGVFVWDASRNKADHNGVSLYAPEAITAWDGTADDITTLLDWSGSGSGLYVKLDACTASNIGCTNTKSADAIAKFYDSGFAELIVDDNINIEKEVATTGDFCLVGKIKNKEKPEVSFSSTSTMRGIVSTGGRAVIGNIKFKSGGTVDQVIALIDKNGVYTSGNVFDFADTTAALVGLSGGFYGQNVSNAIFEGNETVNAWRDHDFNAGSPGGFGGNNLARAFNIVNTTANTNVQFVRNRFENIWSCAYINNTSNICFERNFVKDTADSGFFDRCTGGYSKNKRFLFNDFYNIGKAAIKTLDTNNDGAGNHADDALVEGNNIYGWGLYIESEAILAGRGYNGGYNRQELKQKGFKLIRNTFIQSAGSLTNRPFNFPNLEDPEIAHNVVRLVDDDATNLVYILQWARGGRVYDNQFDTNSQIIVSYRQEGALKTKGNKFVVGTKVRIEESTSGIAQTHLFEDNEIINNGTVDRGFGLIIAEITGNCFMKFVGNHVKTTINYQDSREVEAKSLLELSYDMPNLVDNNTIEFADRFATQKSIAGELLNPIYYQGTKGSAKNIGDGTISFKATSARTTGTYTVTGT